MNRNKVAIWLGVLVLAFVVGWLAYKTLPENKDVAAPSEVYGVDTASWRGFQRLAEHLDLQDDQRVLFHERERAYRDSLYYYRLLLSDLEAQIVQALSQTDPDIEQLSKYAHESGRLQERIKRLTIHHFLDLRELCTPEQQEKLTVMFSQMHQGFGQHQRGQGKGRGMQHGRRHKVPN
ncbi:periplasmic heavy metal sensor [Geofilum rubicundum]|uniref:Periplasmic heavy metal sensor n=1 Tax=Geofilum rubicundum JCM 15548 TaxID=1236989 RepID=A0A0E9LSR2_9BACT|nr:periplasmic heavy metal sensor [Geofilum rubicundum]GAO28299.1 hypothetical protein JCM15548_1374 [Geofilum rubicundum JCM 15548]